MSYYKTCPLCGAHLDPGEKCNCDDLRAVCPMFCMRLDWRGGHFLLCGREDGAVTQVRRFATRLERNELYAAKCCGDPQECRMVRLAESVPLGHPRPAAELCRTLIRETLQEMEDEQV